MIGAGVFLLLLAADGPVLAAAERPVAKTAEPARLQPAAETPVAKAAEPVGVQRAPGAAPEQETLAAFARVRRIFVNVLAGGEAALQMSDLLISSIQKTKLFILTEDESRADAVLKGSADDQVFKDAFQSSEGINAHSQFSIGSSASTNQRSNRTYGNVGVGENESQRIEERKHEAIATVRLVDKNGDVIWSATAESMGAKFAGASVDVAEKIAKRLAADYLKAKSDVK